MTIKNERKQKGSASTPPSGLPIYGLLNFSYKLNHSKV